MGYLMWCRCRSQVHVFHHSEVIVEGQIAFHCVDLFLSQVVCQSALETVREA